MKIVGVDLAPKNSGLVIFDVANDGKPNILFAKEIRTEKQDVVSVSEFADFVVSIVKIHDPVLWVVEAPTQQKFSMVNVDVGFNLGILSFILYRHWQSFILIEPGKLYKWVSTHNKDKCRKEKIRAYVSQFYTTFNYNISDAVCLSIMGFYFVKYGDKMMQECAHFFRSSLTNDQIEVLVNKQKTGLFDNKKYFVNLAHIDSTIAHGEENKFYFYQWEQKLCNKVAYAGRL